jgi:PKD repeat protein
MKKWILLSLIAFSFLFLGNINLAKAQCDIVIDMQDSYGDGWNGASVKVYDGATLLGTATFSSGSSGSATISAPDMTEISLVWTAGSYPEECSFTVTNGIGIAVYECAPLAAPDPGEFFVFTNVCSSAGTDLNLILFDIAPKVAAGDVEIKGTVRNERDTPITSFDAVYSVDGVEGDVTTFDGLDIGFNESYDFIHPALANILVGEHELELIISNINGAGEDDFPSNDTLTASVLCVNEIFVKNVVYEEGTGTWCGWCPRGLVGLNTMAHTYTDGTWIGIGVHNSDPMEVNEYDNAIGNFISGYPSGVMNRENVFDPGLSSLEPAYMASKQEIPLAKIGVTGRIWDEETRDITVEATSNFAMDLTGTSYNVAMVIVESGLRGTTSQWNQANYYSGGGNGNLIDWDGTNWAELANPVPAADMVYHHVGRVLVGGFDGISGVIPADVVYGTPYSYEFTHTLADDFNPDNVDLVVLLIDDNTGIIANAAQVELVGGDILSADFTADQTSGPSPLTVNFTDQTTGGTVASWSWDFDNDGVEDSNEQNPSYTFVEPGSYTVTLTVTSDDEENFTIAKQEYINVDAIGLADNNKQSFKCYPNPANSILNVQSEEPLNSIKMYNIGGQLMYEDVLCNTKLQSIDISSFEKGVYFVELRSELNASTIKLIVE